MTLHDSPLPRGWTRSELSNIADVQLGKMLDKKRTDGARMRYLRNINVRWDRVDTSDLLEMPFKESELERYSLRPGDVLVCEGGEPGRAAVWKHDDPAIKYQKALHRVRMLGGLLPRWLVFHLYFDAQRGALTRHFTGTTIKHLPREALQNYPVRVAPLREQTLVVGAIESYFTRLDDAETTLERVQRNLDRYRASVLKAAVEGRLVPTEAELARAEGRDYEPASVLLERILAERRRRWEEAELTRLESKGKAPTDDKWKSNYKDPTAPDTSDMPELPEGWCWATAEALSDETRPITYGVVKLGEVTPGGVPTLRSSNVRHLQLEIDYVKPISPEVSGAYRRTILEGGEVLVTVRGTLGGVVVAPESCAGFNISREVAMISLVETMIAPIVAAFIGSTVLQNWMMRRTRGITYTGVNIATLKELPVPIPPLQEQARILEAVDRHLSIVAAWEQSCEGNRRRCRHLRQAILTWAFEGRLVDQDPTDEPASVLLERVRAEREAAEAVGPQTRGRRKTKAAKA